MLPVHKKNGFKSIIEINVTPLVDVSLVLVIIFMVTVPMLFKPLVDLIMPAAITGIDQNKQVLYININAEQKLFIDSDPIPDYQSLSEQLRVRLLKNQEKVVILRADERLPYEQITQVMAIAKKAGAQKLIFATERKRR